MVVIQPPAPARGRPQVFPVTKGEPARPPGCLPNPHSPPTLHAFPPSLRIPPPLRIITGPLRAPQKAEVSSCEFQRPIIYLFVFRIWK